MHNNLLLTLLSLGILTLATITLATSFQSEEEPPIQEFELEVFAMIPQQFKDDE